MTKKTSQTSVPTVTGPSTNTVRTRRDGVANRSRLKKLRDLKQAGQILYAGLADAALEVHQNESWREEARTINDWFDQGLAPYRYDEFFRLVQYGNKRLIMGAELSDAMAELPSRRVNKLLPMAKETPDGKGLEDPKKFREMVHLAAAQNEDDWQATLATDRAENYVEGAPRRLLIMPGTEIYARFPGGDECVGRVRRASAGDEKHTLVMAIDTRVLGRDKVELWFWSDVATNGKHKPTARRSAGARKEE